MRIHRATVFGLFALLLLAGLWVWFVTSVEPFAGGLLQ